MRGWSPAQRQLQRRIRHWTRTRERALKFLGIMLGWGVFLGVVLLFASSPRDLVETPAGQKALGSVGVFLTASSAVFGGLYVLDRVRLAALEAQLAALGPAPSTEDT